MADPESPVAQRLRAAINGSDYSVRSLSRALAARPDVSAEPESLRRSISRWLAGHPLGTDYRAILEDALSLPPGTLIDFDSSEAVSRAAELVRLIDAGGPVTLDELVRMEEALHRYVGAAKKLGGRLRREIEVRRSQHLE